jgi:GYF domain 2
MSNWFYQLEGKEAEGPVSTTQLKELAKNGTLKQTDLIWKEGYEKWVKAKRLLGLFAIKQPPELPTERRKNETISIQQPPQKKMVNAAQKPKKKKNRLAKTLELDSGDENLIGFGGNNYTGSELYSVYQLNKTKKNEELKKEAQKLNKWSYLCMLPICLALASLLSIGPYLIPSTMVVFFLLIFQIGILNLKVKWSLSPFIILFYLGFLGYSVAFFNFNAFVADFLIDIEEDLGLMLSAIGGFLGILFQLPIVFSFFDYLNKKASQKNNKPKPHFTNNENRAEILSMSPEQLERDKNSFIGKKTASGILGILMGSLGIHKFILGLNKAGTITICCSLFCMPIACILTVLFFFLFPLAILVMILPFIFSIVGIIEGITYLTIDREEFYQKYRIEQKQWF